MNQTIERAMKRIAKTKVGENGQTWAAGPIRGRQDLGPFPVKLSVPRAWETRGPRDCAAIVGWSMENGWPTSYCCAAKTLLGSSYCRPHHTLFFVRPSQKVKSSG